MNDVSFYHVTHVPLEQAMPRLIEKIYGAGLRSVILCEDEEHMQTVDRLLWTYTPLGFLPHGSRLENMPPMCHPIWITDHMENPNKAQVLLILRDMRAEDHHGFERCLDMFNGHDAGAVERTRQRWRFYQERGIQVRYWAQESSGKWYAKTKEV